MQKLTLKKKNNTITLEIDKELKAFILLHCDTPLAIITQNQNYFNLSLLQEPNADTIKDITTFYTKTTGLEITDKDIYTKEIATDIKYILYLQSDNHNTITIATDENLSISNSKKTFEYFSKTFEKYKQYTQNHILGATIFTTCTFGDANHHYLNILKMIDIAYNEPKTTYHITKNNFTKAGAR